MLGKKNNTKALRVMNMRCGALFIRVVAVLLVAFFAAAALHELVYALLGHAHDHDHAACLLCMLVHTPVLLRLCGMVLALLLLCGSTPLPACGPPPARHFTLQPDPRAPPVR